MNESTLNPETKVVFKTAGDHHFFGYYDLSPWNADGSKILTHATDFINRLPSPADSARLCVHDVRNNTTKVVGETRAWNFQQGARLQWLADRNKVIYNDRRDDSFISRIRDIESGEERVLPLPILAVSPDGEEALTINFSRLERCGGYGYSGPNDDLSKEVLPENDGIWRLNLNSSKYELVCSIARAAREGAEVRKYDGSDYLAHLSFNRSGTRCCFLHRYKLEDGGTHTRLFTMNPDGSDLYLLEQGNLSHFDWYEDDVILIWGRHRPLISQLRKRGIFKLALLRPFMKIIRKTTEGFVRQRIIGDRCLLLSDKSRSVSSLGLGAITEDGHVTRLKDTNWLLGDAYPDKNHRRALYLFNVALNKRVVLGSFFSLPSDAASDDWDVSGMRSDLHPRWNRNGAQVCFDSVHEGSRQVYILDVSGITKRG